jgi:hypothetical protein
MVLASTKMTQGPPLFQPLAGRPDPHGPTAQPVILYRVWSQDDAFSSGVGDHASQHNVPTITNNT